MTWLRDVTAIGCGLALGAYLVELQRTLRHRAGYACLRAAERARERSRRPPAAAAPVALLDHDAIRARAAE